MRGVRGMGLVAVGVLIVVLALPAAAPAAERGVAGTDPLARTAASYCGKSIWSSGLRPKRTLLGRIEKVMRIIDAVDAAATAVSAGLAILGGSAPAGVAVKVVASAGKKFFKKVLASAATKVRRIPVRKAGLRIRVQCVLGFVPYPAMSAYGGR